MAQGSHVDILMMIRGKNGGPLAGEGQSTIDSKDPLTTDYKAGQFFEIDDFDFGIDVQEKNDDDDSQAPPPTQPVIVVGGGKDSKDGKAPKIKASGGKFSKWVQGTVPKAPQGVNGAMYPIEMEPFSFSKRIDRASVFLLINCFMVNQLKSASVVMRKSAGMQSNIGNIAFLRIDFTDVLIISVDWDGGEEVKEKVKFVCRKVKVQYYAQNPDGSQGKLAQTEELSLIDVTQAAKGG